MPIVTDGPMMAPERGIHELAGSFGAAIGATASEAWADSPMSQLGTAFEIADTKGERPREPMAVDPMGAATGFDGVDLTEAVKPATARMDMLEAIDRVKKAGLEKHLTLPNQPDIPPAQLEVMMRHAQQRREREATIERGPQGFIPSALQVGTSFLVGAADPINVASAFIPVMGELRYGKMLAAAGDSLSARLAVRAGVGAAQGAVGQAALEPLDWWAHTQEGRDFGMADVLHNIMFGAALGGAMHAGGGFISDAYRRRVDRPLFPYDLGEPLEYHTPWEDLRERPQPPSITRDILGEFPGVLERAPGFGTHVPASAIAEQGITSEQAEQHFRRIEPGEAVEPKPAPVEPSPEMDALVASVERQFGEASDTARTTVVINGERTVIDTDLAAVRAAESAQTSSPSPAVAIINDLPPRAHEDAMRVTIAALVNGEPTKAGEMLEAAAGADPRIAESFEAWHGSPHDFDRFDLSKIGTGEGAQAYGHGLYFAENEKVARGYQRTVSDKAFVNKVRELYDEGFGPEDAWAEVKDNWKDFTPGEQRLMLALEKDDWLGFEYPHQAVSAALRSLKSYDVSEETKAAVHAIGNMYRVKIKSNPEHFLDWDKPLSEQSEHVRKALLEHPDLSIAGTAAKWGHDIKSMYSRLSQRVGEHVDENGERWGAQGPSVASKALSDAGIRGIRYLDQRSRDFNDAYVTKPDEDGKFHVNGAGINEAFDTREQAQAALDKVISDQATRNFVVFDDKDIEITHKNGEPVKREEFLQQREAERTQAVKAKRPRGRAAADPQTWSLFEMLAHEGGLRPDPELEAIFGSARGPFVPGFGALIRKNGRPLDDALRLAKDRGYLFDETDVSGAPPRLTPNDLLDRIAEENAGRRQYKLDQQHATKAEMKADLERERHEIVSALHDEIEAATGQKGAQIDPALEKRVVEIVQKEGEHDVLAAYERAIMEDHDRYEASHSVRSQDQETAIPGWDVPGEPGAASENGRAAAGERGQAGVPGRGEGRADGGQPRDGGEGDRGSVPSQLDKAAAWRGIAAQRPDFNDPDIVAASNAAAKVPEPPTKLDERVTAAQKAEAYARELYDMFAHRLPEQERARLDEVIATLDREKADFDAVAERGAACLFEGGGG
ncbi:hypothetical protein ACRQ5Q_22260 [Bradyrhizobium sp. PMVTL-01]|uniref:hypothetical protein n=1 Tax=Bradyrhizobium sp. PMVTL-01 TaxID=3434999 RepID=UPI003F72B71D